MAIAAAITFIISTSYSMSLYDDLVADVQQRAEMYTKLEQIDTYVRAYYDGSINEDELIESLANAYISVLGNAEAKYYDESEYTLYKEHLSGTHLGIGIYAEEVGGYPCITDVIANSPAANAGINIGESIVAINGTSVLELGYDNAYAMLRAESGTPLTLTLRRDGVDRTVSLSTVQMTVASVRAETYGDPDTYGIFGYIQVYELSEKTYQQFMAAYSMLRSSNVSGIIIDLRNNAGMIFEPVFNLLNVLLPEDAIPYVETELTGQITQADAADGGQAPQVPMAVLVNSRTSGPAELFAASLKDNLGASVVGSSSAGKAQLPEIFDLYDSTAISLPVATVSGPTTALADTGIKPDYEVVMAADTAQDLKTLDADTDLCIKKALEVLYQLAPRADQQ